MYRCAHHDALTEIATDLAKQLAAAQEERDALREQAQKDSYAVREYHRIQELVGAAPLPYAEHFNRPELGVGRTEDSRALCVVILTTEGDAVHYPMTRAAEKERRTSDARSAQGEKP